MVDFATRAITVARAEPFRALLRVMEGQKAPRELLLPPRLKVR